MFLASLQECYHNLTKSLHCRYVCFIPSKNNHFSRWKQVYICLIIPSGRFIWKTPSASMSVMTYKITEEYGKWKWVYSSHEDTWHALSLSVSGHNLWQLIYSLKHEISVTHLLNVHENLWPVCSLTDGNIVTHLLID